MHEMLFWWLHNAARQSDFLRGMAVFCAEILPFVMAVVALGFGLGTLRRKSGGRLVSAGLLSLAMNEVLVSIIKKLVAEPRPFEALPYVQTLVNEPSSYAFPSGHTAAAFVIAVTVWLGNRRAGMVFIGLAVLVAWGRVAVGVHWPVDVLAGAASGTVMAVFGFWLVQRYFLKSAGSQRWQLPSRNTKS